jgi:hypothetical protein
VSPSLYAIAAIDAGRAVTSKALGAHATDPVIPEAPRRGLAPTAIGALRSLVGTALVVAGQAIRGTGGAQPSEAR